MKLAQREIQEEERRLRWLRWQVDMTRAVLYQDRGLTLQGARVLVWEVRSHVLRCFPGKDGTFDLVILPKFERVLRERWGEGVEEIV